MAFNTNNFDAFKNGEVFPFIQGKQNPNDFDTFKNGEVFPALQASPTPAVSGRPRKRRIFIMRTR